VTLPPGPVGAQHARLNAQFFQRSPLTFLEHLSDMFGSVAQFDLGAGPIIFVHDADMVRALLRFHETDLRKPVFLRDSNTGYWDDGLTTLNDPETWRARRQVLLPLFRSSLRAPRLALAAELAHETIARWKDGEQIDLPHEVRLLISRLAMRSVLDADIQGFGTDHGRSGLVTMQEAYGEDFTATLTHATGALQMTRPRAPARMDNVVALIHARFDDFVDRGDILSALVAAQRNAPETLSRQDVIGEIVQMLFAGHLTIPFALTQFWRDVTSHKLHEGLHAEATTFDKEKRLNVATLGASDTVAILRESMRLSPPAPILYREVAKSFTLHDYQLPEGLGVWISPELLHRDPRYFAQPSQFQPDRFAAGRLKPNSAKAYIPFGAGPRVCVAAAQSLLQMAVIIQVIAQKYILCPIAGTEGQFEVLSRNQT
jgi:cytochrome P450